MNYKTLQSLRPALTPGTAAKFVSMLSDITIPTIKVGDLRFFSPGYIPYWRAETLLTKEPKLFHHLKYHTGKIFWDIGANVGQESIYAARYGKRVYAFEPNPANYFLLSKNIILNDMQDCITAFPVALIKDTGYISSNTACEFGDADYIDNKPGLTMIGMTVETITSLFNIPFPDILKIDVDGGEADIIQMIFHDERAYKIQFVSVESNGNDEIEKMMISNGFERVDIDDVNCYYRRVSP